MMVWGTVFRRRRVRAPKGGRPAAGGLLEGGQAVEVIRRRAVRLAAQNVPAVTLNHVDVLDFPFFRFLHRLILPIDQERRR